MSPARPTDHRPPFPFPADGHGMPPFGPVLHHFPQPPGLGPWPFYPWPPPQMPPSSGGWLPGFEPLPYGAAPPPHQYPPPGLSPPSSRPSGFSAAPSSELAAAPASAARENTLEEEVEAALAALEKMFPLLTESSVRAVLLRCFLHTNVQPVTHPAQGAHCAFLSSFNTE